MLACCPRPFVMKPVLVVRALLVWLASASARVRERRALRRVAVKQSQGSAHFVVMGSAPTSTPPSHRVSNQMEETSGRASSLAGWCFVDFSFFAGDELRLVVSAVVSTFTTNKQQE